MPKLIEQPKRAKQAAHGSPQEEMRAGTHHVLHLGDARHLDWIPSNSIHLVLTSPPYWTLKKYNDHPEQLGDIQDYDAFLSELDKAWRHCYRALVEGGRVVCVVGDVCIARRRNKGRHLVVPLHADISTRARRIGFDYLTPIFWHKIANASYEVENGSSFLGKPFEPNAIVKNDIEYILMLRKPGAYRKPTETQRRASKLTKEQHTRWFRSFWTDLPGASTREHPAPFPVELANRIIRMFSFVEDTVLDPFSGSGSTAIAALRAGRNSISNEVDPHYFELSRQRIEGEIRQVPLFPGEPLPTILVTPPSQVKRSL